MALDSATKRQAIPGVGRPWMRVKLPAVGKGREWRSSTGLTYPVANFQAPTAAAGFKIHLTLLGVGA